MEIKLTKGRVSIVDDDCQPEITSKKWQCLAIGYAARTVNDGCRSMKYMHREIMCAGPGQIVDHINGDTLDNRKANLRIVSKSQNMRNLQAPVRSSSGVAGVRKTRNNMWQAYTTRQTGGFLHIGNYSTIKDAADARNKYLDSINDEYSRRSVYAE